MKKRLSLFAALAILVTTLLPAFTVSAAFEDVAENNQYKQAITTLSTLKVINGYEDGTFKPEKEISRAEFTKMVVYMLGLDNLTTPITTFNDVAADHWANANIRTAYDLGIINGFDEVTFKPDAPVTYEQALKMLVCTLGYQAFAEANGGYPQGYINQANTLNLTENITGLPYSGNASRGAIAQMMYNALEVDMYELVADKWKATDKTLLNDYLNVKSLKGVVVGVEETKTSDCTVPLALNEMSVKDSKTGEEVIIEFSAYGASANEMAKYLGKTVQIYYRSSKASNDKSLIELSADIYKNDELLLNSDLIDSFEGSSLKYYESDDSVKTTTASIDLDNVNVRYNGRAVDDDVELDGVSYTPVQALKKWLDPQSSLFINGTARLINNTTGNSYNMVDIYDYETIVAQRAVSTSDYKIIDKTISGNSLVLNPDSPLYKFTITKNGSEIQPTGIVANDVINYAESLDGDFYTVLVTSKAVSGKITSTHLNASPKTITIGDKEYKVTDRFLTYMATKEQRDITSGIQITAYQDAFGNLEWGTVTSSSEFNPYAYVVNAYENAEEYYLKLFAPQNVASTSISYSTPYTVKSYKLASNAKLNGQKSSPESIVNALAASQDKTDEAIAGGDAVYTGYNQFIRVRFNASKEIENVITCTNPGTANANADMLVKYSTLGSQKSSVSSSSVSTNNGTVAIKSSLPLFVIPADRNDTEGYMIKSAMGSGSMTSGNSYYVETFDVNNSKYATFLAIYGSDIQSGTPITGGTRHTLVASDIDQEVDMSTSETVSFFKGYANSTTLSHITISENPENDFADLNIGDIILYGLDNDNRADKYIKSLDFSDIENVLNAAETADDADTVYDWTSSRFTSMYPSTGSNRTSATMYNVIRVADSNTLHVTRTGFEKGTGENVSSGFETISIGNVKFFRYDDVEEEFTPYVADSDNSPLTIDNLIGADDVGLECSKIAVLSYYTTTADTSRVPYIVVIYK